MPYLTERESFREVLLLNRLRDAIRRINVDGDGEPWLDDAKISQAVSALERLGEHKVMEANQLATDLLLRGSVVEGDHQRHRSKGQTVRYIDFDHPERNDYLVINQFRVERPGELGFVVPDMNGTSLGFKPLPAGVCVPGSGVP